MRKKSNFIDVMGWGSLVMSGLSLLTSIPQMMVTNALTGDAGLDLSMISGMENMPPVVGTIFENMLAVTMISIIFNLLVFISSIALLKRKEWARLFFIVMMVIGLLWMIYGIWTMVPMIESISQMDIGIEDTQSIVDGVMIMVGLISILMLGLYWYVIKKMMSDDIKAEFY